MGLNLRKELQNSLIVLTNQILPNLIVESQNHITTKSAYKLLDLESEFPRSGKQRESLENYISDTIPLFCFFLENIEEI